MDKLAIVSRKELITSYLERERRGKGREVPAPLGGCNFFDEATADEIDRLFEMYGYKPGVIAGFKQWDFVRLSRDEVLGCAIVDHIFPGRGQVLGKLLADVRDWRPPVGKPPPNWYEHLTGGGEITPELALILRPAVESERRQGAEWYIEDGSGRAVCYVQRMLRDGVARTAHAYLGREADINSSFVRRKLSELLH